VADLDRLTAELRALGRQLDVPPARDVTATVRARLTSPAPRRRPLLRYALVALIVLLSAILAVPPARAAVLDFLRIGGVVVRSEPGPPVPPTPSLTARPVADVAEAERLTGLRVRPPAALGRPDSVLVIEGRVVSLTWRPTADHPEVRLDAFDGRLEPLFEKFLRFGEGAVEVDVGGVPGWYVPGPHEVVYVDPGGMRRESSARLAGPTLIWVRGAVTYRLEADLPAARLAALAASV
jgi:hypothetical protein